MHRVVKISCMQHWIRMELHPDVVVHSLKVLVDPADGSYTPSLLIISAADSLSGMKEVAAVSVGLQVRHRQQMNLISDNIFCVISGYVGEPCVTAANATTLSVYRSGHQTVPQWRYRLQGSRHSVSGKKRR